MLRCLINPNSQLADDNNYDIVVIVKHIERWRCTAKVVFINLLVYTLIHLFYLLWKMRQFSFDFAQFFFSFEAHEMEPSWWFAEREIKIPQISSGSTLRPIFRSYKLLFSREYLSSTQTWTSFNCPFTKIFDTSTDTTKRLMNGQGLFRYQSQSRSLHHTIPFDYYFSLLTRADVWTFTIIYQRPTTTLSRRKAFFLLFFSLIQLMLQGEGPLKMDTPSIFHF